MSTTCHAQCKSPGTGDRRSGTLLLAACILNVAVLTTACSQGANGATAPPEPLAVQIGAENVVSVKSGTIIVGPIVSGELTPSREATVRAEIGGAILDVSVDEAQPVSRGALLARIETRTLEDARQSAASALRSAENQLGVARRETERTERLVEAGALASRELDVARNNVAAAEASVADARARLASAERSLGDTTILAPFNGIVASRSVNTGDVVVPGTELFRIIDPSSMRLEASVPSEDLSVLRAGATVEFTVRGYDRSFTGRIERIAPQADSTTRQVPIYVAIPNVGGRLVAGLFAEGRVVSNSATGLIVPVNAVNTNEAEPWVLRVRNGTTERVAVSLGLRDPRREEVQVASGLTDGDVLLRGAAQGISPGTPVKLAGAR
jgi:RND family efflux transporter MFP subunit